MPEDDQAVYVHVLGIYEGDAGERERETKESCLISPPPSLQVSEVNDNDGALFLLLSSSRPPSFSLDRNGIIE